MVLNEGLGLYRVCRRKNDRKFIGAASLPPATFGEAIDLILIIIVLLLLFGDGRLFALRLQWRYRHRRRSSSLIFYRLLGHGRI